MKYIDLNTINKYKNNLFNFSNLTEEQIRTIWCKDNKEFVGDLSKIIYNYNIPLYQKMIFRLRNELNSSCNFYKGCDPHNQTILLNFFNMNRYEGNNIIEFFAWITNWLNKFEVKKLTDKMEIIQLWINKNSILFFFSLEENKQKHLIEKYNKECIDVYNQNNKISIAI